MKITLTLNNEDLVDAVKDFILKRGYIEFDEGHIALLMSQGKYAFTVERSTEEQYIKCSNNFANNTKTDE